MEKFSKEANGYSRKEVNQFVDHVLEETKSIADKFQKQKEEIQRLEAELEYYKKLENSIKDALIKAEETGESIKRTAREESDFITNEAKQNASRIVNDALLRAEKIETQRETLENNMKIFKRKLKLIIQQQMAVVEEIDKIELENHS